MKSLSSYILLNEEAKSWGSDLTDEQAKDLIEKYSKEDKDIIDKFIKYGGSDIKMPNFRFSLEQESLSIEKTFNTSDEWRPTKIEISTSIEVFIGDKKKEEFCLPHFDVVNKMGSGYDRKFFRRINVRFQARKAGVQWRTSENPIVIFSIKCPIKYGGDYPDERYKLLGLRSPGIVSGIYFVETGKLSIYYDVRYKLEEKRETDIKDYVDKTLEDILKIFNPSHVTKKTYPDLS